MFANNKPCLSLG